MSNATFRFLLILFLIFTVSFADAASQSSSGVQGFSGNTRIVGTTSGALVSGNCLKADANGNIVDHGAACGVAAGTVTTTGTPSSGELTAFSGSATITTGNLSGDVTTSGTLATTIANNAVTFGKMADVATDRLIGRDTASTGDPEALTVGGGLEFTGSGGIQTSAFTGNVTKTAGGTALTIANSAVTNAMLAGSIDAATKMTGILPSANGGTGNGFTKFTGPSATEKSFALPNVSATILTDNTAVTVAQGGTNLGSLTANAVLIGNGTGTPTFVSPGANGNVLTSNGTTWASSAPSGGAAVVLASGTVTGLTNSAPQTINLNSLGVASGTYSKVQIVLTNWTSSGGITGGANLSLRFAVNGTAGATAYGVLTATNESGSAYTDTEVTLLDNNGISTITDGGCVIELFNYFTTSAQAWGKSTCWNQYATAGSYTMRDATFMRDVAGTYDGVTFHITGVDADTQSFDYEITGIK